MKCRLVFRFLGGRACSWANNLLNRPHYLVAVHLKIALLLNRFLAKTKSRPRDNCLRTLFHLVRGSFLQQWGGSFGVKLTRFNTYERESLAERWEASVVPTRGERQDPSRPNFQEPGDW